MKLEYIQIENFKQYFGSQLADFSISDDLNVTVFHGVNGAGKTSLFSAISWCLYKGATEGLGDIINRQAIVDAEEGDEVSSNVTVAFLHEGHRFIAKREIRGNKTGDKLGRLVEDMSLARVSASGDLDPIPNFIGQMNAILPENVRPYFFFDGEKLDDLTKADSTDVEDAIRNIIRLPAIERAEKHLSDIAGEFRRNIKREASGELELLISEEEILREEREQILKRRNELREAIKLARGQISDIEKKLQESEGASQLQHQRDQIRKQLITLEELEVGTIQKIQQYTNRIYPIFVSPAIKEAMKILDKKRERGEIPSGIREQFLKDLIEASECICGRPFESQDQVYLKLSDMLEGATPSSLETEVLQLGGDLRNLSSKITEWLNIINGLMEDRVKITHSMDELRRELDNVERQLEDLPFEELAGLERRRSELQKQLELHLHEDGGIERRLNEIDSQIEGLRLKIQKVESKQKKLALLARKEDLAQRATDAVSEIKKEFIEDARKNVESATKIIFDKIAWKEDHFQDITVSEDFRMEVVDRWGVPTRRELSAGERQILSLSFICAMAQISGEESPLVMDTPFGRLSGDHLAAVAEILPRLTPQLVLFVTDREWDKASSTNIEPKIGEQYELSFDQSSGCTTIKEIEFS